MYRIILLQLFLALFSTNLTAQEPVVQGEWNERLQQMSVFGSSLSTDGYRLGPGDLIAITVFGVDDFSHDYRISASNTITMPFLGRVPAGGLTGEEFEVAIAERLQEGGLVNDPLVSVFIKEYRSQPIYVLGAVNQPGQYMITHQLTLIDVLTMAGGVDPERASPVALIQRPRSARAHSENPTEPSVDATVSLDTNSKVLRVDLEALLKKGELSLNLPVQGGDIIHVPVRRVENYYVVGEVIRPGIFELPVDEDNPVLLLTQAVAKAGGPAKTAKLSDGILVRYLDNGQREEFAVDFNAILRGRKSDLIVQPNDIIFIPGSKFKTIGYGLLGVIPNTVTRTVTQGVY